MINFTSEWPSNPFNTHRLDSIISVQFVIGDKMIDETKTPPITRPHHTKAPALIDSIVCAQCTQYYVCLVGMGIISAIIHRMHSTLAWLFLLNELFIILWMSFCSIVAITSSHTRILIWYHIERKLTKQLIFYTYERENKMKKKTT